MTTEKINTLEELESELITPKNAARNQMERRKIMKLGKWGAVLSGLFGFMTMAGCAEIGQVGKAIGEQIPQQIHQMNEQARADYGIYMYKDSNGKMRVNDDGARTSEYNYFYGQVTAGASAEYPGGAGAGISNSEGGYHYKEDSNLYNNTHKN